MDADVRATLREWEARAEFSPSAVLKERSFADLVATVTALVTAHVGAGARGERARAIEACAEYARTFYDGRDALVVEENTAADIAKGLRALLLPPAAPER